MNTLSAAWFAGLLDADGCITAYWQHARDGQTNRIWRPIVRIQLCHLPTIQFVARVVRGITGKKYKIQQYQPKMANTKLAYAINVGSKAAVLKLIETLLPFFVTKQRQAQLVLELCAIERDRRRGRYVTDTGITAFAAERIAELKRLNFRGIPREAAKAEPVETGPGGDKAKVQSKAVA